MIAAVYRGKEDIQVRDISTPVLNDGEIAIRVRSVGVCPTDVKAFYNGSGSISAPRIIGHEVSGEVTESKSPLFRPGQRVNVAADCPCMKCRMCLRGYHNMCMNLKSLGINVDGAYAEVMRVPAEYIDRQMVVELNDSISFDEGALIEPVAVSLHSIQLSRPLRGNSMIIGDGPNALIHLQLLKRVFKSENVVVLGLSDKRLRAAESLGADGVVNVQTESEKLKSFREDNYDLIDITIGNADAVKEAFEFSGAGTSIVIFGGSTADSVLPVTMNQVHYKQLTVTGSTGTSLENYIKAAGIVNSGVLNLKSIVSAEFPLSEIHSALEYSKQMSGLKAVVHPAPIV